MIVSGVGGACAETLLNPAPSSRCRNSANVYASPPGVPASIVRLESGRDRRRDTIGIGHELEHDGDNFGAHITLRDRDAEQAMPGRNVEHLERFGRRLRDEIRNGLSFGMYRSSGQA